MQEAFERALRNNPQTNLRRDIRSAESELYKTRAEERRKRERGREMVELLKTMENFGVDWYRYEILDSKKVGDTLLARLKEKWIQKSMTAKLFESSLEERISLLSAFASGAELERKPLPEVYANTYQGLIRSGRNALFNLVGGLFGGKTFSVEAEVMIKGFSDVSGLSHWRRVHICGSVYDYSGDSREVSLNQAIGGICNWISYEKLLSNLPRQNP